MTGARNISKAPDDAARLKEEPFGASAFRRALGRFATGVCVVTTTSPEGGAIGLTVNSFTSVSLAPPLILWCLSKNSSNRRAYENAEHYAVGILSEPQRDIAMRFAREAEDRFSGLAWHRAAHGVPVIEGTAATLLCRRYGQADGGDHVILIAEVIGLEETDLPPLVFHLGDFGGFKG